jgi:twitching motility protein PilT
LDTANKCTALAGRSAARHASSIRLRTWARLAETEVLMQQAYQISESEGIDKAWPQVLRLARSLGASDVHWSTGEMPWLRVDGQLRRITAWSASHSLQQEAMMQVLTAQVVDEIRDNLLAVPALRTAHAPDPSQRPNNLDFAVSLPTLGRFRVNAFEQARGPSLSLRLMAPHIPDLNTLKAPNCVAGWGLLRHGLVLITGPTGSGKSTLLAALVHHINTTREAHILTLEDPIEYVHTSSKSLIHQREVGRDTPDFESGLRAALREDPDVLLVGELRDSTTIRLALTAAETGHLVLATLHTASAPQALDRLVDAFPSHEREGVRALFAECLVAVLSQTLCPHRSGQGRVAAHEIMVATPAVRNLLREGKVSQLYALLQTGQAAGMQTLDQSLVRLFHSQEISLQTLEKLRRYPQNSKLVDNHASED